MDAVVGALADQMAELDGLLRDLDADAWRRPSPCPGWTVREVVLHLAQTDEMAALCVRAGMEQPALRTGWVAPGAGDVTVDDAAAQMVEDERGLSAPEVYRRWQQGSRDSVDALAACAPDTRVRWVTGDLAARTLASTRLAECWIHTTDVAEALGVDLRPTARLWHVARLAHRTLPYAFARAGSELRAPVTFRLTSPVDGDDVWVFGDDDPSGTVVAGPAFELCSIAARRVDPATSAVVATGPDADAVLTLVRTFA